MVMGRVSPPKHTSDLKGVRLRLRVRLSAPEFTGDLKDDRVSVRVIVKVYGQGQKSDRGRG